MRTTLDIDDDLLAAAQALGRKQGRSTGQVISALVRQALAGLEPDAAGSGLPGGLCAARTLGFRPFVSRGIPVTHGLIDTWRDADDNRAR